MAKERAIDLQLIKPVTPGSSGGKGKITLKNLFKIYFRELNVGFYDPCCDDPATCPPISQDPDNTLECRADGLYATGGGGGTLTGATNGVSLSGTNVVLGQNVGQVGNPATLLSDREIPLNGNDLSILGDTARKYIFEPFRFHLTNTDEDGQITARSASFSNTAPTGSSLLGLLNATDYFQMVLTNSTGIATLESSTPMIVGTQNTDRLDIITNGLERISILGPTGNVGIRTLNPTAQLHLPAGATGATNAPLKFTSGALMTTPEAGAVEFDGTHFYGTIGSTRYQLDQQSGTQGLDSVLAQNQTLTANRLVNLGTHNIQFVNGFIGIQIAPTAHLHLAGAGVTPGNAPLKFASGSLLTTAEVGAVEYDGTNLYFTPVGTTRRVVPLHTGSTAPAPGRINFTDTGGLLNNNANLLYSSANNSLAVGTATNANALLILGPSTSIKAPLRFDAGVVMTTPVTGSFEYDGANLFFTRTGTTRESILTGVSGAAAPNINAGATVTSRYGGDTTFLGNPNSWASVVIGGTTYKIPLYT